MAGNPYTNPNATLTGAASDQELGRQVREQSQYRKGYEDREVEQGVNQAKQDLAMMILNGNPQEQAQAAAYAQETGMFNPQEMEGLAMAVQEKQMRERVDMQRPQQSMNVGQEEYMNGLAANYPGMYERAE